ncbi:MAG TPA: mannose-6-phosphate isomerase, class I [Jatrophihabitans sp.]|nr:mannose-6-phosphate isomerase, class I [Jatrophihabitans sp.]
MTLPRIIALDNSIRDYAWGSPAAIPALLGIEPSGRPAAELWVGAHPDSPSRWTAHPDRPGLDELIEQAPAELLGTATVRRFGPRLPFLVKVLAADRALSMQVHPALEQAQAGYAAEQAAGLVPGAPGRNYTDANHKPELAYALSDFDAFCGFRPVADTARLLDALAVDELSRFRDLLMGPDGLRATFTALLSLRGEVRDQLVAETLTGCRRLSLGDGSWSAAARASLLAGEDFPGDIGAVLALLLNHVRLAPGEAIFLGAGNVHAYLRGTCVEVLANSDNVLRCGLTPKHVDVAELVRIADFSPLAEPRWQPEQAADGEVRFRVPVPDFVLDVVALTDRPHPVTGAGPYLVLAGEEPATVRAGDLVERTEPWHAVFLAARQDGEPAGSLTGSGRAFLVSCDTSDRLSGALAKI